MLCSSFTVKHLNNMADCLACMTMWFKITCLDSFGSFYCHWGDWERVSEISNILSFQTDHDSVGSVTGLKNQKCSILETDCIEFSH